MVQSSNDASMKDATTKFSEEEYVLGMVQRKEDAVTNDVTIMPE